MGELTKEVELGLHHRYEVILLNIFAKASIYTHLPNTKALLGYDNAFEVMIEHLSELNLINVEKTAFGRISNLEIKNFVGLPIKYYGVETEVFSKIFERVESPIKKILANSKRLSNSKNYLETVNQKELKKEKTSNSFLIFNLGNHSHFNDKNPKFLNVVNFKEKVIISPDESYVIIGDQNEDGLQITMIPLSNYSK